MENKMILQSSGIESAGEAHVCSLPGANPGAAPVAGIWLRRPDSASRFYLSTNHTRLFTL